MSKEMENNMSFEEALKKLERLVKELESGDVALSASLAAFEEGISLVRFCTEQLESAEQKVKILLDGADGKKEIDFEE